MSLHNRTLLLGLDGASYTALDPMIQAGVMPFLKGFIDKGVRARLMSTPCPVTPPAWTSMMTGRGPGHHGIFDFIKVTETGGDISFRLMNARDMQAETIWALTGRQNVPAGVLNFPATYLCPPFNGYLVPGFVTSRVLRTSVQPREFWDTVKNLPGFNVQDASWDLDEGRIPLSSGIDFENLKIWIDYLKRKENGWYAIARELIDNSPCQLVAVVFEGVDRLQHQVWNLLDPQFFPKEPTEIEVAARDYAYGYYRHLDGLLRQLVEAAGPEARTFVVSDHGFGSTTEIFYANVWLEKNGYLKWKKKADDTEDLLTAHNMREHFQTIDWENTVAYARTTSANGIYIRVAQKPGDPGIPPEKYHELCDEIEAKLLNWKDPNTGTAVVTSVMRREKVFPGVAMSEAPSLTLTLRDGGFLSILGSREIVKPRSEVKGTHRPDGIFIAGGKSILEGLTVPNLSILDVAPTLLYSLGMEIPTDYEGNPATQLFDPKYVTNHPVKLSTGATQSPSSTGAATGVQDVNDENVILERLKALGYVE
jgi:predicted AlkP superfamily phosphohydrolase/phosphomutase